MERVPAYIWMILKFFGFQNNTDERKKFRIYVITAISLYMISQTIISAVKRWHDLGSRYLAIEDFDVSLFCTLALLEYTVAPENVMTLVRTTDDDYFRYDNILPKSIYDYKKDSYGEMKSVVKQVTTIHAVFYSMILFPPFFLTSLIFYQGKENEYGGDKILPLPFECWYPFPTNKMYTYLILYSINSFYSVVVAFNAMCIMGITVASLHHLSTEIRLLSLSILNIDKIISNDLYWEKNDIVDFVIDEKAVSIGDNFNNSEIEDVKIINDQEMLDINSMPINENYHVRLKRFSSMLVQHHISIVR